MRCVDRNGRAWHSISAAKRAGWIRDDLHPPVPKPVELQPEAKSAIERFLNRLFWLGSRAA